MSAPGKKDLRWLLLAGLIGAGLVQWVSPRLNDYHLQVILAAAINAVLAVSLNLVNGYTGQFSLGHAGFMAVGAYASAWLTTLWPPAGSALSDPQGWLAHAWFLLALIFAGLVAALSGFLVGLPSLRLRGDYLAIVTLGFGEIIRVLIQSCEPLGGATGITGVPPYTTAFFTLAAMAVAIYTASAVVRSTYGIGYLATRDNEVAAEAVGIDTTRCKVNAFVVGAFAGVAGCLDGHLNQYINPGSYGFTRSVEIVAMVILGGMGSTAGVAIAAVVMTVAMEPLREFGPWQMVVYAVVILVFMLLRPQGVMGSLGDAPPRRAKKDGAA